MKANVAKKWGSFGLWKYLEEFESFAAKLQTLFRSAQVKVRLASLMQGLFIPSFYAAAAEEIGNWNMAVGICKWIHKAQRFWTKENGDCAKAPWEVGARTAKALPIISWADVQRLEDHQAINHFLLGKEVLPSLWTALNWASKTSSCQTELEASAVVRKPEASAIRPLTVCFFLTRIFNYILFCCHRLFFFFFLPFYLLLALILDSFADQFFQRWERGQSFLEHCKQLLSVSFDSSISWQPSI